MSLAGVCTICTDYLDCDKDVSVTQCGHLFHLPCLNQWIATCQSRPTCPQCRTRITPKQVVNKIYINVPNRNTQGNNKDDVHQLKHLLEGAEAKICKLNSDVRDVQETLDATEKNKEKLLRELKQLKAELKDMKSTNQNLKTLMNVLKTEVDEARASKKRSTQLEERMKTLVHVETVLNGQKCEVDEMMRTYNCDVSSYACKQLAIHCVALKQEYETVKESKTKFSMELNKLKRKYYVSEQQLSDKISEVKSLQQLNSDLKSCEEELRTEIKKLKKKLTSLENAIASPSDTKQSAMARLLAESPAPQFLVSQARRSGHGGDGSPILRKKIRLSPSCETVDVKLTDDSQLTIEPPKRKTSENKLNISFGSPASTTRLHQHCKAVRVLTNETNRPSAVTSHDKLKNKFVAVKPNLKGFDGLGGNRKFPMIPPSSTGVRQHCNTFTVKSGQKDRFSRLKRLGPK